MTDLADLAEGDVCRQAEVGERRLPVKVSLCQTLGLIFLRQRALPVSPSKVRGPTGQRREGRDEEVGTKERGDRGRTGKKPSKRRKDPRRPIFLVTKVSNRHWRPEIF